MTHQDANANISGVTRAQGRRKSNFPGLDNIPADATLDFVSGGTNFKIPLADFLAALTVTGTIVQDGDPTATPILDVQGAVNQIRNLQTDSNSGIAFNVAPDNGIYVKLDAQSVGSGVPVLAPDNTIRRIKAGSGIAVVASNGDVIVSTSAVPGLTRVVVINELGDFPAPSGGVIPLVADTVYFINAQVDVGANVFSLVSNTVVLGLSALVTGITSSATGTLFLNAGGFENEIGSIRITAPNCTIMGVTIGGGVANVFMHGLDIKTCVTVANINAAFMFRFEGGGADLCSADAFVFSGANSIVNIIEVLILDYTGSAFALGTATFDRFNADLMQITSTSPTNLILDGVVSSGNINAGGSGDVSEVDVSGTFTDSVTILSGDVRWDFDKNSFIADSHTHGLLSLQSNAVNTVISVATTPVLVAGVWVIEKTGKMVGTTGGRLTYKAQRDVALPLTASLTVEPVSGPSQTLSVYVAINGSVITNSKRSVTLASGVTSSVTVPWDFDLSTDDFVEMFVANDSATNDILVSSAVFRIG